MDYLDAILNLVVVGLWLLWSSGRTPDSVARSRTTSHLYLGALVAVVVVRALFYWQIGSAINWVFQLTLGPTSIAFRSHDLALMFFFSILGALRVIVVFLVVTLAIGVLGAPVPIREQPGLIWMSVCPLRPGGRGWVAGVISLLLNGAMWPPVWWLLRWKELIPSA